MESKPKLIAYVRWRDASHGMGEIALEEMGLSELEEVGFLVKEDEESITLAMEPPGDSDSTRLWLTIPKVGIVEMKMADLDWAFRPRRKKKVPEAAPAEVSNA